MKSQPFFFDANIFDDDTQLSEEERARLPEFSREEMEAARLGAFEEGKKAGYQESQESITNTILTLLQKIEQDVSVLFSSEEKRKEEFEQSATHLAAQIFTKAFPVYMEAHGLKELTSAVTEALSAHMVPDNIQIEINDNVFTDFTKLIEEHTNTLQKQIEFKTCPSLPECACRISWPGGGLLCDRDAIAKKIFDILNQSLAERGFSIHDGADCENNDMINNDASAEEDIQDVPKEDNGESETTTSGET